MFGAKVQYFFDITKYNACFLLNQGTGPCLTHRGNHKELFELVTGKAERCNQAFLRTLGFHPNGDEYWFFRIKQVIKDDSVFSAIVKEAKEFKHSPHIVCVENNVR